MKVKKGEQENARSHLLMTKDIANIRDREWIGHLPDGAGTPQNANTKSIHLKGELCNKFGAVYNKLVYYKNNTLWAYLTTSCYKNNINR